MLGRRLNAERRTKSFGVSKEEQYTPGGEGLSDKVSQKQK
jgi:hypothetical protein